jgi:hypothetical protein
MVTHVVVVEKDAAVRVRRVRLRDRLRARVRATALDQQLATGASPDSSVVLAVHAGHLCAPHQRRTLARSLTRLAAAADTATRPRLTTPVCRPAIHRSGPEITAVVERLVATEPVSVQGVARVRRLLADGGGPLYRSATPGRLRRELLDVLRAMDCFA